MSLVRADGLSVGWNLLSAFIGFLLTIAWGFGWTRFRFRRGRKFWKPFVAPSTAVVLGELKAQLLLETGKGMLVDYVKDADQVESLFNRLVQHLDSQENSGLIGRGDLEALLKINDGLAKMNLPAIWPQVQLSAEGIDWQDVPDVIVIGSGDMNPLTKDIMGQLKPSLRIEILNGRNAVVDKKSNVVYGINPPSPIDTSPGGLRYPERDFGLILRAKNPRRGPDEKGEVLLIAGAHGHGTYSVAEACFDRAKELLAFQKLYGPEFQCVVEYEFKPSAGDDLSKSKPTITFRDPGKYVRWEDDD